MKTFPQLKTERLVLRAFEMNDAPLVRQLAGEREVAANTLSIPHPYEEKMAEEWIETHANEFEQGKGVNFAITLKGSGVLIGAIGLTITHEHERAELGYWIGKPYWQNGYATEAAQVILQYGFETLGLNRIEANHFTRNPASGRVMQKIGMSHEGHIRQCIQKWGVFEDAELYGILKSEFTTQEEETGMKDNHSKP